MRISVCMGIYNGTEYIREQLESIRMQTRQPDEVILCDDGSTDATYEMVADYLRDHPELNGWTLTKNETNLGYPGNFYHVMECCTGDVVFLADQDDIWDKNKIARMSETMETQPDVKVLACTYGLIDDEAKEIHSVMSPTEGKKGGAFHEVSVQQVFYKCEWPGMVLAYRNTWYQGKKQKKTNIPHDFLICALAAEEGVFWQLEEILAYHRRHDHNTGGEEHRIRRLLNKERKLKEIENYRVILDDFAEQQVMRTKEGQEALRQKQDSMQGRYEALCSGSRVKVLKNAKKHRKEVRTATLVCDLLIVKQDREMLLFLYGLLQVVMLVILRKFYLLTVYQTAVTYLAVVLLGAIVLQVGQLKAIRNLYLLAWSAFHGIIVLGFLTQGTFYLTLSQINLVQIVNLFLGFLIYWILYLVTGRGNRAIAIGNGIIAVLGILNRYLQRFRGAPFQISDLTAARTAGNVFLNYDYTPDLYMVAAVADLILWGLLVRKEYQKRVPKKRQISDVIVTAAAIGLCVPLVNGSYQKVYAGTGQFSKDSYLAELLADIEGKTVAYPDDYSIERAEQILQDADLSSQETVENKTEQMPNIVVIMNEAFSDLRVLGDIETDQPVWEYWDSLEDNCIRGWADVSVFGGTTANSEYEFLSSDSTALYQNSVIPYNNYFDQTDYYQSLVSVLKEQGYETTAFHPYLSSGWNRPQVYRSMQFDQVIFSEDLEEPLDTLRLYTSDQGDYSYIEQYFEQKQSGVPQFFFNVTMQNHSGYTYDGDDFETTVYLQGQKASSHRRNNI